MRGWTGALRWGTKGRNHAGDKSERKTGILVLSLILGIGLSWSILRQRLSGQASVDEIEG